MLARIAHDLYWLGRYVTRAEHTARMLDGLLQSELEGAEDPASVSLSWESVVAVMGIGPAPSAGREALRDEVIRRLTSDRDVRVSIVSCVTAAREGARRIQETISAEMWQALNAFHLGLASRALDGGLRTGRYSVHSYVKERTALFRGLTEGTMQRDAAYHFLSAGGRIEAAAMVLRMLRVALPPLRPTADEAEIPRRDGNALGLLRAVGGLQAFMRAEPSPPRAVPVATFLLFERDFPDSVAASIEGLHECLSSAEASTNGSTPTLRLGRLLADLELRRRALDGHRDLPRNFREIQHELEQVEREIDERYFSGEERATGPEPSR